MVCKAIEIRAHAPGAEVVGREGQSRNQRCDREGLVRDPADALEHCLSAAAQVEEIGDGVRATRQAAAVIGLTAASTLQSRPKPNKREPIAE